MRRTSECAAGLVLALSVLSFAPAVGATTHKKPVAHPKAMTEKAAAKQYLADVAPYNAANDAFSNASKGVTQSSQLEGVVAPLLAALQTFDSLILRQMWPASDRQDVKALVAAGGLVAGDLSSLEAANGLDISTIEANLSRDGNASSSDANILRSDLGLPPPTS
jgi:hypothetical protein